MSLIVFNHYHNIAIQILKKELALIEKDINSNNKVIKFAWEKSLGKNTGTDAYFNLLNSVKDKNRKLKNKKSKIAISIKLLKESK